MSTAPPPPVAYAALAPDNASDLQHIKILAICHWVWGGLVALFSCFAILYIVVGVAFVNGGMPQANTRTVTVTGPGGVMTTQASPPMGTQDEQFFDYLFIGIGSVVLALGWLLAALTVYSGFCMHRKRRRIFSVVIAAINCISFPLGTTLGVFTMIVLLRDSVKRLYQFEARTDGHP